MTGRFDGVAITSDAGGLLLREVETKTGILRKFAACFSDYRDPEPVEHAVYELQAQRVFALALGCEDLDDHDTLRAECTNSWMRSSCISVFVRDEIAAEGAFPLERRRKRTAITGGGSCVGRGFGDAASQLAAGGVDAVALAARLPDTMKEPGSPRKVRLGAF